MVINSEWQVQFVKFTETEAFEQYLAKAVAMKEALHLIQTGYVLVLSDCKDLVQAPSTGDLQTNQMFRGLIMVKFAPRGDESLAHDFSESSPTLEQGI